MALFICLFIHIMIPLLSAESASNYEDCPFTCGLTTDQELFCSPLSNNPPKVEVACQRDLINDRFVIGNRGSIRRILPNGMKNVESFTTDGRLSLFINMNILELTPMSFSGLESVLSNLEVLQIGTLHPDTLIQHGRILSITLDSERIPQLPEEIRRNFSIPTFLRLQPQDPSMPIEVNMNVRCHKCANELPIQLTSILTFSARETASASGGMLDALSMVYMDNCPSLDNALGCPKNVSITDYVISSNATNGWKVTVEELDDGSVKLASGGTQTKPLLLSVIIWCTLLTILLICLIIALVVRCRIQAKRREKARRINMQHRCSVASLKHIICGTTSCEDLNRASLSNGGTWVYETPSQNSCMNLLTETRSQYSYRPVFPGLDYPHPRGSAYSTDLPPGYRASIPECLNQFSKNKCNLGNGNGLLLNGDSRLPPLPTAEGFRIPGTPSYKRSHDGTFKMAE